LFHPSWYPELIKKCEPLLSLPGFGAHLVASWASEIYATNANVEVEQSWIPSDEWCNDFLKNQMGLVRRARTGSTATPEQREVQERIHLKNIKRLSILISEGMELKYIIASDEFGSHFFPQGRFMWAKKGSDQVGYDGIKDDKRSYTGNFVASAIGKIIFTHTIFEGLTDDSLPKVSVRNLYPHFEFSTSTNHWSNHDLQMCLLTRTHEWAVSEYMKDHSVDRDEAIKILKYVHFLDCWPVNLTKKLRDQVNNELPCTELMFVPAGYTGHGNPGDTHLHFKAKSVQKAEAHAWHAAKMQILFEKLTKGTITESELNVQAKALMKLPVLRDKVPVWLQEAVDALEAPISGEGRNLVRKAFDQVYLEKALSPGIIAEARAEQTAARAAAAEASKVAAAKAAEDVATKKINDAVAAALAAQAAGASAREAQATGIATAASAAPDAVPAAAASFAASELDADVVAMAKLEESFHLQDILTATKPKPSITGKSRKSRSDERYLAFQRLQKKKRMAKEEDDDQADEGEKDPATMTISQIKEEL
jgi:hypothetical protein